jgi:hypothetical protein
MLTLFRTFQPFRLLARPVGRRYPKAVFAGSEHVTADLRIHLEDQRPVPLLREQSTTGQPPIPAPMTMIS